MRLPKTLLENQDTLLGDSASGVLFKSELGNLMRAEMHRKHSILQGGPQRHGVSPKGFSYPKVPILKRDLSLILLG
jgi:hypothetical protein